MSEANEARVTWETLQQLCVEMQTAKKVYLAVVAEARPSDDLIDLQIQYDMKRSQHVREHVSTENAYQSALRRYQEQGK